METSMEFPQTLKMELPCHPAIPLLSIYAKELKSVSWKDICTPMSISQLLTIVNVLEQSNAHEKDSMEYYSALKKEGNSAKCNYMDESGGHYAKWNKPNTGGQIIHDTA